MPSTAAESPGKWNTNRKVLKKVGTASSEWTRLSWIRRRNAKVRSEIADNGIHIRTTCHRLDTPERFGDFFDPAIWRSG